MSTRSAIARPAGDGWEGRYHHWDGYPTGLGSELWSLFHGRFEGDVEAMRRVLIDEHPAGWSTIVGADWSQEPGFVDSFDFDCTSCGRAGWMHYVQNYSGHGLPTPPKYAEGSYLAFDHAPERPDVAPKPQCYCHGTRGESEQLVTSYGDDAGVEWAYVLADYALVVCERRWNEDGAHMVGMFGMGAGSDGGTWLPLGIFPWFGSEPDWNGLEGIEEAS